MMMMTKCELLLLGDDGECKRCVLCRVMTAVKAVYARQLCSVSLLSTSSSEKNCAHTLHLSVPARYTHHTLHHSVPARYTRHTLHHSVPARYTVVTLAVCSVRLL